MIDVGGFAAGSQPKELIYMCPLHCSRSVGMQSSNELQKLLAKIEELEAQIPVSTDPAERTAMRNVLAAMLQNAAAMRQKEVQLTPGERACEGSGCMV